jgi:hypothetical protein
VLRELFERGVLLDILPGSSPGLPWIAQQLGTNSKVLDNQGFDFIDIVKERCEAMVEFYNKNKNRMELGEVDLEELLQNGLADPFKAFIKGEPHTQKKISEERLRIIFGGGLTDQVIERIIGHYQSFVDTSRWAQGPTMIGIGFDQPHLDELKQHWPKRPTIGADVTGWDWTVLHEELMSEAKTRAELGSMNPESWIYKVLFTRFYCLSRKGVCLSNGIIHPLDGVMPSGSYFTGPSNSRIRVTVGILARIFQGLTDKELLDCVLRVVGDDSNESDDIDFESMEQLYLMTGHPLKEKSKYPEPGRFEMCSSFFDLTKEPPTRVTLNSAKVMYAWIQGTRGTDETKALLKELVGTADEHRYRELIERVVGSAHYDTNNETAQGSVLARQNEKRESRQIEPTTSPRNA